MKKILFFATMVVAVTACKTQNKKTELVGKWQAVSLENPQLNAVMKEQLAFLDTAGNNTTPTQNLEIYGTNNLDSFKAVNKDAMVEYQRQQDQAVKNTWFDFKKEGTVTMNFGGSEETYNWEINDAGMLMLNSSTGDTTDKINLEILSLSDTLLKLQMTDQGMASTVIFKPANK